MKEQGRTTLTLRRKVPSENPATFIEHNSPRADMKHWTLRWDIGNGRPLFLHFYLSFRANGTEKCFLCC
jgi:hypothetical protein